MSLALRPAAPEAAEQDRLLDEITRLLQDLHRGGAVHLDLRTDLARDLGLDSLAMVELLDRVEHAFEVKLPEGVLSRGSTPADWLEAIHVARGQGPPPRVFVPGPSPAARVEKRSGPERAGTLAECLAWHAGADGDLVGIRLLRGGGRGDTEDVSYLELQSEATICAKGLLAHGLARGQRVGIMLPTCRDYFVVFMGTLLAGGVPVPIYPPARLEVLEEHLRRQALLLEDAGATMLVTVPEALIAGRLLRAHAPSLEHVLTPKVLTDAANGSERLPTVHSDDIALIQYTSGSTSEPKGVVLTHAQLLANVRAMGKAADVTNADVFVSWLPLYHDMGLIGAWHAASLYFGMLLVIMSPLDFLARPVSWFEAISKYSGTLSAAPNFAYQSCVDRIEDAELEGLDLSSWRLTFNGSEPVSSATTERFIARFGQIGFRRGAMCPAYGLAEVGVGVAFTPLGRGPRLDTVSRSALAHSGRAVPLPADDRDAVSFVGCGVPLPGYEIRVRKTRGQELAERHEGHVECRGPSATSGYFGNEEATRSLWASGWLDTGDLGYVADGELYLTGRAKDLVIRAGRNLHPEELEQAFGELEGVCRGGVAVFASSDQHRGTERLIVVAESLATDPTQRDAVRNSIARSAVDLFGAAPDEVVLAGPGAVLRTASGKIRRSANREAFEAGTLGRRRAPVALQLSRFALSGLRRTAPRLVGDAGQWLYAGYVWLLVSLVCVPVWGVVTWWPLPLRTRWRIVRLAGRSLVILGDLDFRIEGNLPDSVRGAVIVSNHASFVDGLALILASRDPIVLLSSTDFEHKKLVGRFLRRLGCVFVRRDDPGRSTAEVSRLIRIVEEGKRLAVFPEGSITRAPGLRQFHLGAFAVACATQCPVIPVGIRGTRDIVRPGRYVPRHGHARVVVGAPLSARGEDFAARVELAERARGEVALLSGEPDTG